MSRNEGMGPENRKNTTGEREVRTKAQNALTRAIANRRREIAEEKAEIDRRIAEQTPAIRAIAKNGTTLQRRLAVRWLALGGDR